MSVEVKKRKIPSSHRVTNPADGGGGVGSDDSAALAANQVINGESDEQQNAAEASSF